MVSDKQLVKTVSTKNEEGRIIDISYFLLEKEIKIEGLCFITYGIGVELDDEKNKYNRKNIADIFCTKNEALNLIKKLADNSVTPITLEYILEDVLGVYEYQNI